MRGTGVLGVFTHVDTTVRAKRVTDESGADGLVKVEKSAPGLGDESMGLTGAVRREGAPEVSR